MIVRNIFDDDVMPSDTIVHHLMGYLSHFIKLLVLHLASHAINDSVWLTKRTDGIYLMVYCLVGIC